MISCVDFIPLYSELFSFLDERGGRAAVEDFWDELADHYFDGTLKREAAENGVRGCWNYWRRSLAEEAADTRLVFDPAAETFSTEIRRCPSKGRLLDLAAESGFVPYPDYCDHCIHLYRRVLAPLGLVWEMEIDPAAASCVGRVRRPEGGE